MFPNKYISLFISWHERTVPYFAIHVLTKFSELATQYIGSQIALWWIDGGLKFENNLLECMRVKDEILQILSHNS